jgi:hypothetical protein
VSGLPWEHPFQPDPLTPTACIVCALHPQWHSRPLLRDDPASVERLREKIHEVWGWCAPDDNPDDPVCRGKSCERGAKSLIAALVAEAK